MRKINEIIVHCTATPEGRHVTVANVHPQSFYDLVNIIREYEEIFPAWHTSDTAKLYSPAVFVNKKKSGGYWF